MSRSLLLGACLLLVVALVAHEAAGDLYLHHPPGSNNRNAEKNQNRNNAQRCFDSENNGKGGYPRRTGTAHMYNYYVGSEVPMEWTSQHGSNIANLDANIVVDYMRASDVGPMRYGDPLSDGQDTDTLNLNVDNPETDPVNADRCLHEPLIFYRRAHARFRNKGVWTAQENVRNSDLCTRQNPNGQQHGSEVASEKDYYPAWQPTPWRDIAWFGNTTKCAMIQAESFNVKGRYYCNEPLRYRPDINLDNENQPYIANNEEDCTPGLWVMEEPWGIDPPICEEAPTARDNHLGNARFQLGNNVEPAAFNWTIPSGPTPDTIIIRVRYNITTGDYDQENLDSSWNEPDTEIYREFFKKDSEGDPIIALSEAVSVQLAVNPQQFGRTFEDRSHLIQVLNPELENINCNRIVNLNVRGKRGNIVQSYPAVEYDFIPSVTELSQGDCVHIQWSGTDAYPGGQDGQGANQDGGNLAQMPTAGVNLPSPLDLWTFPPKGMEGREQWIDMAIRGCGPPAPATPGVLDNAPYSCDLGLIRLTEPAEYFFMNTRNNNFSNRSQKLTIRVTGAEGLSPLGWTVIGLAITSVAVGAALAIGVVLVRKNPGSKLAGYLPTRFGAASTGVATKQTNANEFRKAVDRDPSSPVVRSPFDAPSTGSKRSKPPVPSRGGPGASRGAGRGAGPRPLI